MPMPQLPDIHHSSSETKSAFQVKKNSAAIAPTWNRAITEVVTQFIDFSPGILLSKPSSSLGILILFSYREVRTPSGMAAKISDEARAARRPLNHGAVTRC